MFFICLNRVIVSLLLVVSKMDLKLPPELSVPGNLEDNLLENVVPAFHQLYYVAFC